MIGIENETPMIKQQNVKENQWKSTNMIFVKIDPKTRIKTSFLDFLKMIAEIPSNPNNKPQLSQNLNEIKLMMIANLHNYKLLQLLDFTHIHNIKNT